MCYQFQLCIRISMQLAQQELLKFVGMGRRPVRHALHPTNNCPTARLRAAVQISVYYFDALVRQCPKAPLCKGSWIFLCILQRKRLRNWQPLRSKSLILTTSPV